VVERARLAGLDDRQADAELLEGPLLDSLLGAGDRAARLEDAPEAEGVVADPGRVAGVHDEPAVGDRRQPGDDVLETRLCDHAAEATDR
jgi:hypothetical protein